jgi:polyhydroxyalkanoate synthesis regulator phasin
MKVRNNSLLAITLLGAMHTSLAAETLFPEPTSVQLNKFNAKHQKHVKLLDDFSKEMKFSEKEAKKIDDEMKKILLEKQDDKKEKFLIALPAFYDDANLYDELGVSSVTATSWEGSTTYPNHNDWLEDNWAVADFDPKSNGGQYHLKVCRYNQYNYNRHGLLDLGLAVTSH